MNCKTGFVAITSRTINRNMGCMVCQGLRTLELCVDNLQPDFLYNHIQPVRAELMQVGVYFVHLLILK